MGAEQISERADFWSIFRRPSKLEWRIARRYLRSRRTSRAASLNTVISTGGVMVGVMDDWQKTLQIVRQQPGVVAAAPEVISQAGITAGQDYGEGVNLVGFDPDTGTHSVTSLPQSIQKGDLSFRTTKPNVDGGILLGARLANRLSVYPGDVVTLVPVTQAKVNPALGVAVPRFWRFEVTGLFDTGMFQYDNQFVVVRSRLACTV